jgi:hypothetical protein
MPKESVFVEIAMSAANEVLASDLEIRRGEALYYQITIDEKLDVTVNPQKPMRGQAAFQTDLCVFEKREVSGRKLNLPRVVLEMKDRLTTHDVLTYSTKAKRHKQVYPYLRYGLIVANEAAIPKRFFRHNDALDFCAAVAGCDSGALRQLLKDLIAREVEASRQLERIAFGPANARVFRYDLSIVPSKDAAASDD